MSRFAHAQCGRSLTPDCMSHSAVSACEKGSSAVSDAASHNAVRSLSLDSVSHSAVISACKSHAISAKMQSSAHARWESTGLKAPRA